MLSFDVESLFTNIPALETIDIILKRIYSNEIEYFHGLNKDELKKLLIVCTQESHFQFNNEFFDQVDGVSMGSPLGPLFANIFMADFEEKQMVKLRELSVNIKFTIEKEEKKCLPFLDT